MPGIPASIIGVILYLCLNASYTVAVFTDPGSPLTSPESGRHQYSALPVTEQPEYTAFTVSSSGGSRFCKKCQAPKPDRAHHCSTCNRCVLKMDHHCPWLATCVGLHNYKPFLLFLIYTCLFCWVCFVVASHWTWTELLNDTRELETTMPVNVVLLAILGGIIGLVLSGFTAWHFSLAIRGMTTIECLEKTRYVSPLRKALDRNRFESLLGPHHAPGQAPEGLGHRLQDYGHQILDAHANAIPGVTRAEEGVERVSVAAPHFSHPPRRGPGGAMEDLTPAQRALSRSYEELERQREYERYHDYLNEEDNEKMPNAFDLGWRRNLLHLFGEKPLLWLVPVCNTTGDGWRWEPSRKFLEARERVQQRTDQAVIEQQQHYRDIYQRNMDNRHDWMGGATVPAMPTAPAWAARQPVDPYSDSERPATGMSMKTLAPMSPRPRPGDSDYEDSFDEDHRLGSPTRSPERRRPDHRSDYRDSVAAQGSRERSRGHRRGKSSGASVGPNHREERDGWRDWE